MAWSWGIRVAEANEEGSAAVAATWCRAPPLTIDSQLTDISIVRGVNSLNRQSAQPGMPVP